MTLLMFMLSIKKVMSKRFYCVNKTQRWSSTWENAGVEYKIISHNVMTSFFICVFNSALKTRDGFLKRERDKIISKEREKLCLTYL